MSDDRDDLLRRLAADEWLRPGEVAALLDTGRTTINRMLTADPPQLRYRLKAGTGRHREINPEDVRREIANRQTIHGAEGDAGA